MRREVVVLGRNVDALVARSESRKSIRTMRPPEKVDPRLILDAVGRYLLPFEVDADPALAA